MESAAGIAERLSRLHDEYKSAARSLMLEVAKLHTTTPHVPPEFIRALDDVLAKGVKHGRESLDWQCLTEDQVKEKLRSLMRHTANGEYDAAACNCLILWWHLQRKESNDQRTTQL